MIIGKMDGLQAKVEVVFFLPGGGTISLEFVIDTGFVGALTLPSAAVATMNLPFVHEFNTNLANDSSFRADAHRGVIMWHGQTLSVPVLAMGRRPLLGTALLAGYDLNAEFAPNGRVEINDIP